MMVGIDTEWGDDGMAVRSFSNWQDNLAGLIDLMPLRQH